MDSDWLWMFFILHQLEKQTNNKKNNIMNLYEFIVLLYGLCFMSHGRCCCDRHNLTMHLFYNKSILPGLVVWAPPSVCGGLQLASFPPVFSSPLLPSFFPEPPVWFSHTHFQNVVSPPEISYQPECYRTELHFNAITLQKHWTC